MRYAQRHDHDGTGPVVFRDYAILVHQNINCLLSCDVSVSILGGLETPRNLIPIAFIQQ
jgi:hypothetical protein